MRIVGNRKSKPMSFSGAGSLLQEGARFNDEIHRLPGGDRTRFRKGIYRFKTHEEANRHEQDCIVAVMMQLALRRRA